MLYRIHQRHFCKTNRAVSQLRSNYNSTFHDTSRYYYSGQNVVYEESDGFQWELLQISHTHTCPKSIFKLSL